MQTGTTWHKCLFLHQISPLLRSFCQSSNNKELIIAWMTYNSYISIGFYWVCYQNDCKLKGKSLWMPDNEMIPSFLVLTGPSLLVNMLALHQSRALSLHRSKHFLASLPNFFVSIFVSIVLESYLWCISWCPSITNELEYLQNQECQCQTPHTFAKHLIYDNLTPVKKPQ